jgi:hypothetical protein
VQPGEHAAGGQEHEHDGQRREHARIPLTLSLLLCLLARREALQRRRLMNLGLADFLAELAQPAVDFIRIRPVPALDFTLPSIGSRHEECR